MAAMTTTPDVARRPESGLAPARRPSASQARVQPEQFNALIGGLDPRDPGTRLRSSARDPKIAAFDLTFSAPK